jgi:hypothetical protein
VSLAPRTSRHGLRFVASGSAGGKPSTHNMCSGVPEVAGVAARLVPCPVATDQGHYPLRAGAAGCSPTPMHDPCTGHREGTGGRSTSRTSRLRASRPDFLRWSRPPGEGGSRYSPADLQVSYVRPSLHKSCSGGREWYWAAARVVQWGSGGGNDDCTCCEWAHYNSQMPLHMLGVGPIPRVHAGTTFLSRARRVPEGESSGQEPTQPVAGEPVGGHAAPRIPG